MDKQKTRERINEIKQYRCKDVIAVTEDLKDVKNIGTIIGNVPTRS